MMARFFSGKPRLVFFLSYTLLFILAVQAADRDVGANADCKPEYLVQFAIMASAYATKIIGVKNPTVGLLNIGEEETKGSQFAQDVHALLREQVGDLGAEAAFPYVSLLFTSDALPGGTHELSNGSKTLTYTAD